MTARRPVLVVRPSPDLWDRLRRAVWGVVWIFLYRPSPRPLFAWRRFLLRLFGAKLGRGARPYPSARIWAPWNLVMHTQSCLADRVNCYNVATVVVGPHATVSQGAYLCTASHEYNSPGFELVTGSITIEPHCWVATEAFVGPGVTLHACSVVLARSVVVRDVPAGQVVGGNPARQVANRSIHTEAQDATPMGQGDRMHD